MMRLGKDEIMFMNALANVTNVNARDCLIGENVISFVVKENDMGAVIGKKGETIKKLQKMLNRNIEILPYTKDPKNFVPAVFSGIKVSETEIQEKEGKKILIIKVDSENKRKIMQSTGKLKRAKEIAKRDYEIEDIWIR